LSWTRGIAEGGGSVKRKGLLAIFALVLMGILASAQTAPTAAPFRWQMGQVLVYKVEQATQAIDSVDDNKVVTKTHLNLTKRWQVLAVDAQGIATLQLSVTALKQEMTNADGETLVFDSANLDKSTPMLKEQMTRYVNQVLAVLRVDGFGRVVEVKESKFGPASRFETELPFVAVVPALPLKAGQSWERTYQIALDPPHGTGEKYDAVQRYTCKSVDNTAMTIALTTEMKTQPEAVANRVPLVQKQPEGEIVFDVQAGRLRSAAMKIDKELKGHQGEGSSYKFTSSYTEEYIGDK